MNTQNPRQYGLNKFNLDADELRFMDNTASIADKLLNIYNDKSITENTTSITFLPKSFALGLNKLSLLSNTNIMYKIKGRVFYNGFGDISVRSLDSMVDIEDKEKWNNKMIHKALKERIIDPEAIYISLLDTSKDTYLRLELKKEGILIPDSFDKVILTQYNRGDKRRKDKRITYFETYNQKGEYVATTVNDNTNMFIGYKSIRIIQPDGFCMISAHKDIKEYYNTDKLMRNLGLI